jgi:hypothetical protein
MNFEQSTSTAASLPQAWSALADVASLPKWTPSMTSVEPLDGADLRTGRRYRITQPAMPVLVWQVSEVHEGESYVWENRLPGVHTVAYHRLASDAGGGTRITIGIRQSGWFAGIAGLLTARRTRRYLALEAAGLKAASESVA